jgi:hypothetical protein
MYLDDTVSLASGTESAVEHVCLTYDEATPNRM